MVDEARKRSGWVTNETMVSGSVLLALLAAVVSIQQLFAGMDKRFENIETQRKFDLERQAAFAARLADFATHDDVKSMQRDFSAWVELHRAKLPPDLRPSLPEAPR